MVIVIGKKVSDDPPFGSFRGKYHDCKNINVTSTCKSSVSNDHHLRNRTHPTIRSPLALSVSLGTSLGFLWTTVRVRLV
jgi:hypothetical protein